ncbi:hypothetical protein EHW90_10075 [Lachnoanaerobaculum orale]|uniref:Uncharacterized protein n=1 Tax=Lachnoanaerobaculum orale TaxID=979627 RepID=A0A3P3Q850_9FIRM|nr:hypothetical protein [Lachnoanaerobaculum orale]RRJ17295.1 hypothetical protein EHW90_10075 [Lachnoanaerobaculum orale]
MNKEKQKKEYFKSFRYRWISEKIREYEDYNIQDLSEEIKNILSNVIEEKQVYKLKYLTLFFLNTSLYTKSYKCMIYASDEGLYIDKPLGIGYWIPDFMKKDSYKIREEMMKGIGKLLLSEPEIEEGIRFVLKGYKDIIAIFWKKALESVIDTDIFKDTSKELIFLFGEYMGELKQVNLNMY